MKKAILAVVCLSMMIATLTGCNLFRGLARDGENTGGQTANYQKGEVTEDSFESEYLNLRFTAPEGYVMATEEDMLGMMNLGADMLDMNSNLLDYAKLTTVYEMMVSAPRGYPNVILMVEKPVLSNITVEQYSDVLKEQLSAISGMNYSISDETTTVEVAGQSYQQFKIMADAAGQKLTQSYLIRKNEDRIVVFITTSTVEVEEELELLLDQFTTF